MSKFSAGLKQVEADTEMPTIKDNELEFGAEQEEIDNEEEMKEEESDNIA